MRFKVMRNDISEMRVDAVVLPANPKLTEGSGASNAIFDKAGRRELKEACKKAARDRKLAVGDTIVTLAYGLEAKYILHTIVPKWKDGSHNEYELLSSAYLSALAMADMIGCKSVAFPLLASGNNGFDQSLAYEIAKESIESYKPSKKLSKVTLVVYGIGVMAMLKSKKVAVDEVIDEHYILVKAEQVKLPVQKLCDGGKAMARDIVGDGINIAKDYLSDPKHRAELLVAGAKIAAKVIKSI